MKLNRQALGMIFDSCNGFCYYCGFKLDPFGTWEVDHMQPRAQGGADSFYNLVPACQSCNRSKGNRTVDEYKEAIKRRILNHLTTAVEMCHSIIPDVTVVNQRAVAAIKDAEQLTAEMTIHFYGEIIELPRHKHPMWSKEFEDSLDEIPSVTDEANPEASM